MTVSRPWWEQGKGLELVPILFLDFSVSVIEKGKIVIGRKNKLSLGVKVHEEVHCVLPSGEKAPSHTLYGTNFQTGQEYVLSYDPETFECAFRLPSESARAESSVVVRQDKHGFFTFRLAGTSRFLRHCNYVLRFDAPPSRRDTLFDSDCLWVLRKYKGKVPILADFRVSWPTLHVRSALGEAANAVIGTLMDFALQNFHGRRSRRDTPVYELQGAGGMEAGSTRAVDIHPPGNCVFSPALKARVEGSMTVRERGGVARFARLAGVQEEALMQLVRRVRELVAERGFFYEDRPYELGFGELVHQPPNHKIAPHVDGVNDCDFAANFALHGAADVTVERKTFRLEVGDVYLFRPHMQVHQVAPPLDPNFGRYILSLRFFFVN